MSASDRSLNCLTVGLVVITLIVLVWVLGWTRHLGPLQPVPPDRHPHPIEGTTP